MSTTFPSVGRIEEKQHVLTSQFSWCFPVVSPQVSTHRSVCGRLAARLRGFHLKQPGSALDNYADNVAIELCLDGCRYTTHHTANSIPHTTPSSYLLPSYNLSFILCQHFKNPPLFAVCMHDLLLPLQVSQMLVRSSGLAASTLRQSGFFLLVQSMPRLTREPPSDSNVRQSPLASAT